MTFYNLRTFLFGTLRGRLVVSVALIHAIMMTLFIVDLTVRQRAMLLENQTEAAITTSNSLATSAAGWIAADDLSGLQELVDVQRRYPEIRFVILTDETGHILAHTDKSKIGFYLLDLPQVPQQTVLGKSAELVDVAVPAMLNGRHVGWARVGLGQETAAEKLTGITNAGILYALAAIFIGSVIAWSMGTRITQRLYVVQDTMSKVRQGARTARAIVSGMDEAASIAHEFNSMLDTLGERDEALRKSEARYRIVADNTQDWEFWLGSDGNFRYCSPSSLQLTGYAAAEFLSDSDLVNRIVCQADRSVFEQHRRQAEQGHTAEEIEFRIQHKNGTRRWVSHLCLPLYDENGLFLGSRGANRDITRRKEAEEALRKSAEEIQDLYDHAPCGYHSLDSQGLIIRINDTELQWLGYTRDEVIGKMKLTDLIAKNSLPTFEENFPLFKQQGWVKNLEFEMVRKDGTLLSVLLSATAIYDEAGNYLMSRSTVHDITERKQAENALYASENRFRVLSENAFVGIYIFQDGRLTYVNSTLAKIFGYTPEELIGAQPTLVIQSGDQARVLENIRRRIVGEMETIHYEFRGRCKDGGTRNIEVLGGRVDLGGKTAIIGNLMDITERKKAEEALRKNNDLLERIFSSTEFMIAYLDADFNFIRVNRAYAKADERDPEFFVGRNHFNLYPDAKNEAIFRQVVESGETFTAYAKPFEYPENPERGTSYWNWTLQPLKEADGRVSELVFSLVDVTAREKAILAQREIDAKYRTLIEQASDGIFVADSQGNYIDVNPSGCNMLGYTREEILNLNMKDLASAKTQREQPLRFNELQTGKSILSERTLVAKSGELLPVEISGKMLENGQFLGIVRDITERKRHELEHQAIINVSAALRQVSTRTETLNVILKQLEELFETDGVVLVLPNPQDNGLVDEMGCGPVGERMKGLVLPPGKGLSHWVITNKKTYMNNHAEDDPLFYRPDLLGESNRIAAAPLVTQEQAIGALWIARRKILTEHDLHLLTAIADIAASAIHRASLDEQIDQQLRHLLALHEIDIAITANFNLENTLNIILKHVKNELDVDAANVLLINPITYTLDYSYGVGFRTRNIEKSSIKLGEGLAGRAALDHKTASWPDLRLVDDKFSRASLLAEEEFISYHATPMVVRGQVKGVLEVFNRKLSKTERDWFDYFETLATQTAIAIENASLLENLQKSNQDLLFAYDATIEGWSHALDLRDKETEGHSQRVTQMSLALADKIGMSDAEKADLRRGALLHDIGKMGVPDSILHKTSKLTEKEWKIMRQHPTFAYQMLSPIVYLKRALDVCYYHHEKWDGTGYPHRLKGEEIPLAARVFAIVDVFDALTSDRPYRKAWSHEDTCRYIQEQAGRHFDPQIVKIFLESKQT